MTSSAPRGRPSGPAVPLNFFPKYCHIHVHAPWLSLFPLKCASPQGHLAFKAFSLAGCDNTTLLLVWALISHHGHHVFDTNSVNLSVLALRTSQESTLLNTPLSFRRRTNSCHAHSFHPPIFFSAPYQRGAHANHPHRHQPSDYTTHMSLPIQPNRLGHCLELRRHYLRLHLGFYAPQHPRFEPRMDNKEIGEDRDDVVGVGRARINSKLGDATVDWRSTSPT